ncbi:MAG TPA: PQQ-binding-like beta-propeller repeat protein [Cellulomonas sp.]|uniref:outer membrane protein assembly factor BamB family protein n=1 Tax=Cellulomonas sp. TaxID=40001 RepID=UPI002E374D83|nr:PQQ-binding-like beta-propeller repeat protein [Cellulomonas sp.]HEX5331443.1 PQQ-binding-like beta-propeller repeat protein [Cellulomonas sp.]
MGPAWSTRAMQDVELAEDGAGASPGARSGPGSNSPEGQSIGLWTALRRWWPVAVLVALAVAASSVAIDRRDAARSDRIAAEAGMIRPLTAAPSVLWRATATAADDVLAAGGALVVVGPRQDLWRVTSLEPATGAARWSTVLAPVALAGTEGGGVECPHSDADVGSVVVCVVTNPRPVYTDGNGAPRGTRTVTHQVVALGAQDGAVLGQWTFTGTSIALARAGDDVVVAATDADLFVEIARRAAVTGDVAWRHRSGEAETTAGTARVEVGPRLVLLTGATSAVLDAATGTVVFWQPSLNYVLTSAVGDEFVTWSIAHGGMLHDATGAPEFAVPGFPAEQLANDGSAPDVLVIDQGRWIVGEEATTGRQLWSADTALDPVLTVDHQLVLAGGARVGVLDLRTGAVAWSREVGESLVGRPLSDGALVVAMATTLDGSAQLEAFGLHDGVPYWSLALPDVVRSMSAQGGHLLVRTAGGLVALG